MWRNSLTLLGICFLTGCTTTIVPTTISNTVLTPNTGILSVNPDLSVTITGDLRTRYNAMVQVYGHDPLFLPPLTVDVGVTPQGSNFAIDQAHFIDLCEMNTWRLSQTHIPAK